MKKLMSRPIYYFLILFFLSLMACADLVIIDLFAPSKANAGQYIEIVSRIKNIGDENAVASQYALFLSRDPYFDLNDHKLGQWSVSNLEVGQSSFQNYWVQIPTDFHTGKYFILAIADVDNNISQNSKTNDLAYRRIEITGESNAGTDLLATNVFHPSAINGGASFDLFWTLNNMGQSDAPSSRIKYYFSKDAVFNAAEDVLLGTQTVGGIPPSGSRGIRKEMSMPNDIPSNLYYMIIKIDADDEVIEFDEKNNIFVIKISVEKPEIDLVVNSLKAPLEAHPGETINTEFFVRNRGYLPAATQTTAFYLSDDNSLDDNDLFLDAIQVNSLEANSDINISHKITIPDQVSEGIHYLYVVVDDTDVVLEEYENNNYQLFRICIHDDNPFAPIAENDFIEINAEMFANKSKGGLKRDRQAIDALVKMYPNPTADFLNVITQFKDDESFSAVISDVSGKVLKTFDGKAGQNQTQIDLSYLPKGTYVVHLQNGNEKFVEKIVVK